MTINKKKKGMFSRNKDFEVDINTYDIVFYNELAKIDDRTFIKTSSIAELKSDPAVEIKPRPQSEPNVATAGKQRKRSLFSRLRRRRRKLTVEEPYNRSTDDNIIRCITNESIKGSSTARNSVDVYDFFINEK